MLKIPVHKNVKLRMVIKNSRRFIFSYIFLDILQKHTCYITYLTKTYYNSVNFNCSVQAHWQVNGNFFLRQVSNRPEFSIDISNKDFVIFDIHTRAYLFLRFYFQQCDKMDCQGRDQRYSIPAINSIFRQKQLISKIYFHCDLAHLNLFCRNARKLWHKKKIQFLVTVTRLEDARDVTPFEKYWYIYLKQYK